MIRKTFIKGDISIAIPCAIGHLESTLTFENEAQYKDFLEKLNNSNPDVLDRLDNFAEIIVDHYDYMDTYPEEDSKWEIT